MKGSKILLSALLLISVGAYAMESGYDSDADYSDAQETVATQEVAQGEVDEAASKIAPDISEEIQVPEETQAVASTGAIKGFVSGLRGRVSSAGSLVKNNTWERIPSMAQVKNAFAPENIKDFVCNLPSAMRKHYFITTGVVVTTAAAIVLYKRYCDKNMKSKARKRKATV